MIAVHPCVCGAMPLSGSPVCVSTISHRVLPRGVNSMVTTDGRFSVYCEIQVNLSRCGRSIARYSPGMARDGGSPDHIDAIRAADPRIDSGVHALHLSGLHELHEAHGIRPRVERFFTGRVQLLSHNQRPRLHMVHRCVASQCGC